MTYSNRVQTLPEMSNCEIVLNEIESPSYSVGDIVGGHLVFIVSKSFSTSAIRVVLEGIAVVENKAKEVNSETFLKIGVDVLGDNSNDEKIACNEGEHRLPFSIILQNPQNPGGEFPGTMRTAHGHIQYQLAAYVKADDDNSKSQKVAEKTLIVLSYYDLSAQESSLMTRIVYEKIEKSVNTAALSAFLPAISRASAKLRMTLRLKRSGFLPGESILFKLELYNPADHDIKMGGVTLIQKYTYGTGRSQKVQIFEIRSIETREALQGLHAVWVDFIQIPVEGMVSSQNAGIIEISHFLKIRITSNSPDGPLLLEAPLKIGTAKND